MTTAPATAPTTSTGAPPPDGGLRELVTAYYAAVDAGDLEGLLALFDEEAVYRRPGYPPLEGRGALQAFYASDRIIAEGRHTISRVLVDGDLVATEGSFCGTARDGRPLAIRFSEVFRCASGRIVERSTYFDAPGV
jgi:ketosteroid isomerase-like protein